MKHGAHKAPTVGAMAFVCAGLVCGLGGAHTLRVQAQIAGFEAPRQTPTSVDSPPYPKPVGWSWRISPAQETNPLRLFVPYPQVIAGDDSVVPAPFSGTGDGPVPGPLLDAPSSYRPLNLLLSMASAQPDSPPYAGRVSGDPLATLAAVTGPGAWYAGPQASRAGLSEALGVLPARSGRLSTSRLERLFDIQMFGDRALVMVAQQNSMPQDLALAAQRPPVASGLRMHGVHPADTQYGRQAVAQVTAAPSATDTAQANATPQPTPTLAHASYSQQGTASPVTGGSAAWTAATMPGGNARPYYVTGYTATGNPTYTGTIPHWGTVAVDPHVIPLGSTVYIQGLGIFKAEDTGGAIIGYRVDVFVPNAAQAYALTGVRLVSFIPPPR